MTGNCTPCGWGEQPVRVAELMACLSDAADLGMGHPKDYAVTTCVVAVRLGEALRAGGLFVTHNIDMAAPEYLKAISTDGALESTLVNVGSGGIAVTLKKRS